MNDLETIENKLKEHKQYLKDHFHVEKLGIFGSYSKGDATSQSDVDILVEFNDSIGWKFVSLKEFLEKILGKNVDLATENALRSQMKEEILNSVIYV